MSENISLGESEKREVWLFQPDRYVSIEGVQLPSPHQLYSDFETGFVQYLQGFKGGEEESAQELLGAVEQLDNGYIALAITSGTEVDWSNEQPMSTTEELFNVLEQISHVLQAPGIENQWAARDLYAENNTDASDLQRGSRPAPLVEYTQWLFQDRNLGMQHARLWDKYIAQHIARSYVEDRPVELPGIVEQLYDYKNAPHTTYATTFERVANGEDTREMGINQMIAQLISEMHICEEGNQSYDFRVRQEIAERVMQIIDQPEVVLTILLEYLQPVDIDCDMIDGAIFKPAIIRSGEEALFEEWQRYDSFWFNHPFDESTHLEEGQTSNFPDNPQIVRMPLHGELPHAKQSASHPYKDCSYFRADGSKVYWGDLTNSDVEATNGNYYCVSQSESFHRIPDWAVNMASFMDNDDPNRPIDSLINTPEFKAFFPDNPILVHPDYIRAAAVGAIVNSRFVKNPRHPKFDVIKVLMN